MPIGALSIAFTKYIDIDTFIESGKPHYGIGKKIKIYTEDKIIMKEFVLIVLDSKDDKKMKDLCFQIERLLLRPEFTKSTYYKFESEKNKDKLKYIIDNPENFKEFSHVC